MWKQKILLAIQEIDLVQILCIVLCSAHAQICAAPRAPRAPLRSEVFPLAHTTLPSTTPVHHLEVFGGECRKDSI